MKEITISDAALRKAAEDGMDAFVGVFITAIREAIGGELTAETMAALNSDQVTLLIECCLLLQKSSGSGITKAD